MHLRWFCVWLVVISVAVECSALVSSNGAGVPSGGLYVDVYSPDKTCNGTTLFSVGAGLNSPRIVEVNMQGDVVWEYVVPDNLSNYTNPGFEAELLTNDHVLIVFPRAGIYEIDRAGNVVWSNMDANVSHDADRLPNGNTLYVFGNEDTIDDAIVKEVNSNCDLVWSWYARDHFACEPYTNIYIQGWTHVNGTTRMTNGNTLVNIRNFDMTVEVNPAGDVVWMYDWQNAYGQSFTGYPSCWPHDPELLRNGHLVACLQDESPYQLAEIDRTTSNVVWTLQRDYLRTTRDGNRLRNGNSLLTSVLTNTSDHQSIVFEATSDGDVVWQVQLKDCPTESQPGNFFKAQRVYHEKVRNDFTGDGASDMGVFDSSGAAWYVSSISGTVACAGTQWGWAGVTPVCGDYDGDGSDEPAVFDGTSGNWYLSALGATPIQWGWAGAEPVSGDYDGDGIDDLAVFDSVTGYWYVRSVSGDVIEWATQWGWPGAEPVAGDYDGNAVADMAVYDSNTGYWYVRSVYDINIAWATQWGWPGAVPLSGDYNGDEIDDLAVYDSASGLWYVLTLAGDVPVWAVQWGMAGGTPVSGDFDGDGLCDMAVFDSSTGRWYIRSVAGESIAWDALWGWPGATALGQ